MTASPSPPSPPMVYAAISDAMADLSRIGIAKDARNEHDRYSYRSIDAMLNALSRVLASHRLIILPCVTHREVVERESKNGGLLLHVVLTVRYTFISAVDGSRHEIEVMGEATDRSDKAVSKAMTAAFKYACVQCFCIGYEGMPDADSRTEGIASSRSHGAARTEIVSDASPASDELAEDLADAIDRATDEDQLTALVSSLRKVPVDLREPLRTRFAERRASLRGDPGAG